MDRVVHVAARLVEGIAHGWVRQQLRATAVVLEVVYTPPRKRFRVDILVAGTAVVSLWAVEPRTALRRASVRVHAKLQSKAVDLLA